MDVASHRQKIAIALSTLETSVGRLVEELAHDAASIQIEPNPSEKSPVRQVCEAYSAIDYGMNDGVGFSVVCLGIVGATPEIVRRAQAVNSAKAQFKAMCTPLYRIRTRIPVEGEHSPARAVAVIRVILRDLQRSELNLLAAYRKIPILESVPKTVTYTRANTRSVYRKTIAEIHALLNRREGPTTAGDRERLALLDRRETHLALVKERYQNIRANVLYAHLDTRGRGRLQLSAELPILYPKGRRTEPPQVRFPLRERDTTLLPRRRQTKLELEPFFQSLPVYRYASTY
jgi:hypothetical protein